MGGCHEGWIHFRYTAKTHFNFSFILHRVYVELSIKFDVVVIKVKWSTYFFLPMQAHLFKDTFRCRKSVALTTLKNAKVGIKDKSPWI